MVCLITVCLFLATSVQAQLDSECIVSDTDSLWSVNLTETVVSLENKLENLLSENAHFSNSSWNTTSISENTTIATSSQILNQLESILKNYADALREISATTRQLLTEYDVQPTIQADTEATSAASKGREFYIVEDDGSPFLNCEETFGPTAVADGNDNTTKECSTNSNNSSYVFVPVYLREEEQSNSAEPIPRVNNVIEATEPIGDTFQKNIENFKKAGLGNLLSNAIQQIVTREGVTRFYPAPQSEVNLQLYDPLLDFIHVFASTGTKDIVILYDTSGSMSGEPNALGQFTVSTLLNSLAPTDKVAILSCAKECSFIDSANLLPVVTDSITMWQESISSLSPKYRADFDDGLTQCYQILNRTASSNRQLIFVISDGTDFQTGGGASKSFNADKTVAVYTFRVGNTPWSSEDGIKDMACDNRGIYRHVMYNQGIPTGMRANFKAMSCDIVDDPISYTPWRKPLPNLHAESPQSSQECDDGDCLVLVQPVLANLTEGNVTCRNGDALLASASITIPTFLLFPSLLPSLCTPMNRTAKGSILYGFFLTEEGHVIGHPRQQYNDSLPLLGLRNHEPALTEEQRMMIFQATENTSLFQGVGTAVGLPLLGGMKFEEDFIARFVFRRDAGSNIVSVLVILMDSTESKHVCPYPTGCWHSLYKACDYTFAFYSNSSYKPVSKADLEMVLESHSQDNTTVQYLITSDGTLLASQPSSNTDFQNAIVKRFFENRTALVPCACAQQSQDLPNLGLTYLRVIFGANYEENCVKQTIAMDSQNTEKVSLQGEPWEVPLETKQQANTLLSSKPGCAHGTWIRSSMFIYIFCILAAIYA
eukprot:m.208337 g.208337  ORF g.208337 m.208337 type:complete len:827 (+) comp15808_c0_seq2:197-2677(+)